MILSRTGVIGYVIAVSGSQMTVRLTSEAADDPNMRIGAMVKCTGRAREALGTVSAVKVDAVRSESQALVVDFIGEVFASDERRAFVRGVSQHPAPGSPVVLATEDDVRAIFSGSGRGRIRVGSLYHNENQAAYVKIDDLLGKHFAILGASGSGKSCTVALILSAILERHPNAHVLMLDPHNEYSAAFGDLCEVINVDNLQLPLWLLDFEELTRVLVRGGTPAERESEMLILRDVITRARRHFAGGQLQNISITVDTPAPFRISDVMRFLNESMGQLEKADSTLAYLRLRSRLEALRGDRRFSFMFSETLTVHDVLPELVGTLLRIPVNGKPLAIVDLSGVPSEVTDVVVSVCCRLMFDFAVWSKRELVPPVLLVCEEAHRYIPAEHTGVTATSRSITRIAKEGRKYGLSLALVSQRPTEVSTEALSQCGTVFALRLGNDRDQDFVARSVPDAAHGILAALPSLPTQQAIVSGEGVPIPMRIHLDSLPPHRRPRSHGAIFSLEWDSDSTTVDVRDEGVRRWRAQTR